MVSFSEIFCLNKAVEIFALRFVKPHKTKEVIALFILVSVYAAF